MCFNTLLIHLNIVYKRKKDKKKFIMHCMQHIIHIIDVF